MPTERNEIICLIGCVKSKQSRAVPAKDLYTSTLFRSARAYAEEHSSKWFILSAKYGLVCPEMVIEPYEQTLRQLNKAERSLWAKQVFQQLVPHLFDAAAVELIAGLRYRENLAQLLDEHSIAVLEPLTGLGLGKQISWLQKHTSP